MCRIRDSGMHAVQLVAVVQDVDQAEAKHVDDVQRQGQQEQEEVAEIGRAHV